MLSIPLNFNLILLTNIPANIFFTNFQFKLYCEIIKTEKGLLVIDFIKLSINSVAVKNTPTVASDSRNKVLIYSFEPISECNAEILILGSMPGQASLAENQYYANLHNVFWKIMAETLEFSKDSAYEIRLDELKAANIALWDVLQSCARIGSLDVNIKANSMTANDFQKFFQAHKKIHTVLFNGAKAESAYGRYVLPLVNTVVVNYLRLPSTSPAHASLSYELKLKAWKAALKAAFNKTPISF